MTIAPGEYAVANRARFLEELKEFLRIPSISTLPQHQPDMERAAGFVRDRMIEAGLENVHLIPTAGNPLVYGEWLHAEGAPTVLCYGHYDVQPSDPLSEWKTPPFEPTVRDGKLYARGAADDKGQFYAHIKAVESLMKTRGALPVNVRFLVEGEEEVGGKGIETYVQEHPERLHCDVALVSDTALFAPDLPSIDVGLRGMVYTEVEVRGAESDLHSGLYGGAAPNPFDALARIIVGLKDEAGRIQIPGFYDAVAEPSPAEKASWGRLPFDEEVYRKHEVRASYLPGEAGYSVLERTWVRPTLEVHGMPGGFMGAGAKTVIPARAVAKISMRLVPNQKPETIKAQFEAFVQKLTPHGYTAQVRVLSLADPVVVDAENRFIRAAVAALKDVFQAEPVFVRSGGSIPIVALFAGVLHAPTVMMGFGLPDDGLHAPNEKFNIENYDRGVESVIGFFERLGGEGGR
ncbi:MAG: dipeptidase [Terriglobales bacterium]